MKGHSVYDPYEHYVSKEDLEKWSRRDPIARLANTIYNEPDLSDKNFEDEFKSVKSRLEKEFGVEQELQEALEWAKSSPQPEPSDLYTDISSNPELQKFIGVLCGRDER